MTRRNHARRAVGAVPVVVLGAIFLAGCALIQPPPVPRVPHLGLRGGVEDASCAAWVGRAHAALAGVGGAAGDPSAVAAAHAAYAMAIHEYHTCLARDSRP